MFNLGFDPEQFASLGSSFDEPDPFVPTPVAPTAPKTSPTPEGYVPTVYSQAVREQNYGAATRYDTPQEAFSSYGSFVEEVQGQMAQTASVYNYNNYDPGDFARAGQSGPSGAGQRAGSNRATEYILENKIPPSIEVDGQTLYFTSGFGEDALGRALGDDYKSKGSYESHGPAGTYSTVYVPSEGLFDSLHPALRGAIALATRGMSEAFISATQAMSGETLHLNDWLNLANAGMQIAKAQSPTTATGNTPPRTLEEMVADGDAVSSSSTLTDSVTDLAGGGGDAAIDVAFADNVLDINNLDTDLYQNIWQAAEYPTTPLITTGEAFNVLEGVASDDIFEDSTSDNAAAVTAAIEAGQGTTTITDEGDVDITQTGVTPDPVKVDQPLPEYDLAVEPIVYEPPSTDTGGGGGAGAGGETGGEAGGVATVEDDARGEGEGFEYDRTQFEDTFGDLWLDADFNTLDSTGDGIVSASEMDEYERSVASKEETDPVILVDGGVGSEGTGAVTGTDGTGASTGDSTGAGDAVGTGDGTGTGTGSGDGSGDGSGSGAGIGSSGMLNPQRTTNDLFFKELFQMNTQARDTQQIVRAGQPLQTFQQRQQQLQPVNRPRLGMLTDPELLKRYPY